MKNLRFLVVEDHGFQRWELGKLLEDLGATQVLAAGDGREALTLIEDLSDPVDIIITDLDMPGMDGMEFIRNVGQLGEPSSIILVSALDGALVSSVGNMVRMYNVQLLGVLAKPLSAPKLGELIGLYQLPTRQPDRVKPAEQAIPLREMKEGLRNGEFVPYFQPKVLLANRTLVGAEALARWRNPRRGVLAPAVFITEMENNGLIDELTWSMLAQSAEACAAWRKAGFDLSVAVNLSGTSLDSIGFADQVSDTVRNHHLEPRHVILEITESAVATDVRLALENLSRLRMRGFGLSIDDYGTGYSSMQQLTRISFTELKIDQSFVQSDSASVADRAVLESSMDMVQRMKLSSTAEGIETRAQWNAMRDIKCEVGQGYLVGAPMPGKGFLDWARKWQSQHSGATHLT